MNEVTQIVTAIGEGDRQATEQHLPLVYDELRRLAAQKLACESPGQTLRATVLQHEAYLRALKRLKDILACVPGGLKELLT
jgi:ECF sigma factor